MSSLLSPVGPHPPQVYWVRRLIVLGLPLLLLIIIVVATSGGSAKKPSPTSAGGSPTSQPTNQPAAGGACLPENLSAVLSPPATTFEVGDSPQFSASITNISQVSCELTTSPSNETWTVTSGAAQWWTTEGCPQPKTSSTRTLKAGASRQVSIQWDGHRLEPGCKRGDLAEPGTYHLSATIDGVEAEQVTLHFTKNTD